MNKTLFLALIVSLSGSQAAASADVSFLSAAAALSRTMKTQFQRAPMLMSQQEEQTLVDLLRDRDPEVRRSAVRALRKYVTARISTRDAVLDVLRDRSELTAVRREAAKTLSAVAGYSEVSRRLLEVAAGNEDSALRATAYKSLYWQAASRGDVRQALARAARTESDLGVRLGAIWGLFLASGQNPARDVLIEIAWRENNEAARVEALKSLFGAMGYADVRELSMDLARKTTTPGEVRRAAILLMANRTNLAQRDLLERIAYRDDDASARRAAAVALGGPQNEEVLSFFHLLRRDANGAVVGDPLDQE